MKTKPRFVLPAQNASEFSFALKGRFMNENEASFCASCAKRQRVFICPERKVYE
jgi:hypothetical protein